MIWLANNFRKISGIWLLVTAGVLTLLHGPFLFHTSLPTPYVELLATLTGGLYVIGVVVLFYPRSIRWP